MIIVVDAFCLVGYERGETGIAIVPREDSVKFISDATIDDNEVFAFIPSRMYRDNQEVIKSLSDNFNISMSNENLMVAPMMSSVHGDAYISEMPHNLIGAEGKRILLYSDLVDGFSASQIGAIVVESWEEALDEITCATPSSTKGIRVRMRSGGRDEISELEDATEGRR